MAAGSKPRLASPFLWIDKSEELPHCLSQYLSCYPANAPRFSRSPVEASQLVRENDPRHLQTTRQGDLERIALHLGRYWTAQRQTNTTVVGNWRDNQRRTMPRLLVTGLWIELKPDQITSARNIGGRHYHASRPTASPVAVSGCRFFRLILFKRSLRRYFRARRGRIRRHPFSTETSTADPSSTCASAA